MKKTMNKIGVGAVFLIVFILFAPMCSAVLGDADDDGIPDAWDPDMDGDGILNEYDSDIDGDGVPNPWDHNPYDPRVGQFIEQFVDADDIVFWTEDGCLCVIYFCKLFGPMFMVVWDEFGSPIAFIDL